MSQQPEIGTTHPAIDAPRLNAVALVQLIATVTLALCTLIVATAVSFGLARAEFSPMPGAAPFAVSLSPMDDAAFRS
jgi:cation transporter-like permease